MAKRRAGQKAGADLPVLVNPRLMKGLEHVLRQHILLAAVQGDVSSNELAKLLGKGVSQVSYHVRFLYEKCGLIEETRTRQRRGAVEHYYKATAKTLLPAKSWRGLGGGLRAVVGAGMASDLFDDLANALKAGGLEGAHDHVSRLPLALDEEGRRRVHAIAERANREAEEEQRNASERMVARNGETEEAVGYSFGVLAFETAWEPAARNALARGDERADSATKSPSAKSKRAAK